MLPSCALLPATASSERRCVRIVDLWRAPTRVEAT
jgi:hypothetical protein